MAVFHLNGVTSYGAADKIVEWFTTFTNWLTLTVGWTLEAAPSATERTFSSVGEAGGYTKLFFRIWQDPGTNRIRGEVSDDAVPTHETTEGGYVDTDQGEQFRYYITADLDTVLIAVPYRNVTHFLYLGCLLPQGIAPADETYYMVASHEDLATVSILRDDGGVWDVSLPPIPGLSTSVSSVAGSNVQALEVLLVEDAIDIAGQMKFLASGPGGTMAGAGDRFTSRISSDAVWRVFAQSLTTAKVMLVEGTQPVTEQADGLGFNHVTGVAAGEVNFLAALDACLTAAGWVVTTPVGPYTAQRLCYSPGSDGTRNIWVFYAYDAGPPLTWWCFIQQDAIGTGAKWSRRSWNLASFPFNYWISADRDCFITVLQDSIGWQAGHWAGMTRAIDPTISDSMNIGLYGIHDGLVHILVDRPAAGTKQRRTRDSIYVNSNANVYDPTTYSVWPISLTQQYTETGGNDDVLGDMGLYFYTDGGGIAALDTITVGPYVYTVFDRNGAGQFYAIRTT